MSMRWTNAQRAAIEDRGGTLLVSAAAGSGKTAVLVERAVRLICEEGVAADRLLIVTFTRAAAEELRARIAQRLAEEAAAHPQNTALRRQRMLLGRADIGTIDAFCMQLLKQYFAQLDLPPDFTLAEDALAYSLRAAALGETLEQAYADADFRAFASLYGRARSDGSASGAVLALYDFLRTLPFPWTALERFYADYESGAPLGETAWGRALLAHAAGAVENALALLAGAQKLVEQEPALQNYAPALAGDASFFSALQADVTAGRWDAARVRTAEYRPQPFKAVRGYDGPDMDAVKALRTAVKKEFESLRDNVFLCTEEEFCGDRARIAPMLRALGRAARDFSERFYAAKLAEKALEYSDFEHLAIRLLCTDDGRKTAAAKAVSRRYDAVMVDEYQDTNSIQALLYQCLANDEGSNLFFVGDVKQSIYRFRLANPQSFLEKRAAFAPYVPGGPHPAALTLGHNFRSAKSVIGAVNDVFATLMSPAVGDVAYDENERLVPGTDDGYDGGPLELRLVDVSAAPDGGDAGAVAAAVAELVRGGFAVREKNGGTRPCRWGDCCVLLRSRARFAAYEAAFERLSIPAAADTGDSPLTAPETAPLIALLRVLDNPSQDVFLAAVMLSPMFGFTADDLARLRLASPAGSLYAALLKSTGEKERALVKTLRALRARAAAAPVEDLCDEILARTHYFAAVGAMENGPARRENLRAFTAWAKGAGAGGLAGLVRAIDSAVESGALLNSGAPALPEGSVSIMTVHRSKGLEFPVVILADTARRFNLRDVYDPVLFHPRLGVGMNLRQGDGDLFATVPHRAIRLAQKREAVSEEMRILYVALTRARDKLVVTAPLKDPAKLLAGLATQIAGAGGVTPYLLSQGMSFAEWLCAAALVHPDCEALRKAAGGAALPLAPATGRLRAVVVPAQDAAAPAGAPAFRRQAAPDAALERRLLQNFSAAYEKAPLSALPAKVSVSALAHKTADPMLARPAFLYRERVTAAERGTAMHTVLQFADFDAAARDFKAELARLVEQNYLDADLAAKLRAGELERFFASPLCMRMRAAQPLLREYAFLTGVPAKYIQPDIDPAFAYTPVLVQGIADAVLVTGKTAEIADYKSDRLADAADFVRRYAAQLLLYKAAVEKRLGVAVTRCTIYSLHLGREIDVPLDAPPQAEKTAAKTGKNT